MYFLFYNKDPVYISWQGFSLLIKITRLRRENTVNIPQLRMESQMARIGINQTKAQIGIEQPKAELSIEQPNADMSIETTKGKLTIDQTQAWEEMNLESTPRLVEKHAQESVQLLKEGTARRAEQGAQLLDIHQSDTIIAEQARENQLPKLKQLSIKYIPSPLAVKLHYEKGDVNINFAARKPVIDVQINKPEITYSPGNVDVTMKQYAELKIDFV